MQPQLWSPGGPIAQSGLQRHIAASDSAPAQLQPVGCPGASSSQPGAARAPASPALVAVRIRVADPSQAPHDASGSSGPLVGCQPAADPAQTRHPSAVPGAEAHSAQHGESSGAAVQQESAAASSSLDFQRRHDAERSAQKQAAGERWADVAL